MKLFHYGKSGMKRSLYQSAEDRIKYDRSRQGDCMSMLGIHCFGEEQPFQDFCPKLVTYEIDVLIYDMGSEKNYMEFFSLAASYKGEEILELAADSPKERKAAYVQRAVCILKEKGYNLIRYINTQDIHGEEVESFIMI
jgi:hypothetical protein